MPRTAIAGGVALLSLATLASDDMVAAARPWDATSVAGQPPAGAPGAGDPYFPLDGNGGIDVASYDIHDRYDFSTGKLSGWTRLRLTGTKAVSRFSLDFLLPVRSVRVEGRPVDFHQQPHEVGIDRRLKAGETVDVRVSYAGYPAQVSYQGEKTWNATKTEVVANGEPHMAPRWFPANDHPSDKARMRISITVPSRYDVIANGKQVSRVEHRGKNAGRSRGWATTTWRADEPMTSYLAYFAAGRYRTAEGTSRRGTPWLVAVSRDLPRRQQHASMNLMLRTPRMADWLETQLGDYPFATTGGLTHSLPLGFALENQTRPTYSAMGLENVYVEEVVVHELAHEWFGNSVALRRWSDIWLNEGIATFFEWRWFESGQSEKKAELTAAETLRDLYDNSRSIGRNFWKFQLSDPCVSRTQCAAKVFDRAVYLRGAMTTQALRNRIGERHFWELLRRWTAEHAGGHGTTHEFEALAEEVSGADLNGFFEAWLRTASKPASTRDNGLG